MNQLNQIEVMERKLMRDQQIKAFQAQGRDSNSMNLGLQEYDWNLKNKGFCNTRLQNYERSEYSTIIIGKTIIFGCFWAPKFKFKNQCSLNMNWDFLSISKWIDFSFTIIWENKRGKKWKKSGIERESRRGANHDDHQAFAFDEEGQRWWSLLRPLRCKKLLSQAFLFTTRASSRQEAFCCLCCCSEV